MNHQLGVNNLERGDERTLAGVTNTVIFRNPIDRCKDVNKERLDDGSV